ncbi:MAG: heme ABC exporter ATP-binding protein CcmA [Chloroflexi bacterium]|nr:heme ABC exporter ATP-binding protein CcmA [Chloroflexota bacterium]
MSEAAPPPEAASQALRLQAVSAHYQGQSVTKPALADVTLAVQPGERVLIAGPNGAGKSTLLRIAAGLMRPSAGGVWLHGVEPRRARQVIGYLAHATLLYDELTAQENLLFAATLYGVPEPGARVETMLRQVGLSSRADSRVDTLSRGQQQRVALARALVHRPAVLLLDEPDTGLDAAAFDLLEELVRDAESTVLLATHDLQAGARLCQRTVVLTDGRVSHHATSGPLDARDIERHVRGAAASA